MNKFFSNNKQQKGQGLVEYAIILALVAIVVIGAMRVFGPEIGNTFSSITNSLPGGSVAAAPTTAPAQPTGTCYLRWTGTRWVHWYDNTPEVPGVCP